VTPLIQLYFAERRLYPVNCRLFLDGQHVLILLPFIEDLKRKGNHLREYGWLEAIPLLKPGDDNPVHYAV